MTKRNLLKVNATMVEMLVNGTVENFVLGGKNSDQYVLHYDAEKRTINVFESAHFNTYLFPDTVGNVDGVEPVDVAVNINDAIREYLGETLIEDCGEFWEIVDSISDLDDNYVVIAHCSDGDVKIGGVYEEIHEALIVRDEHLHICEGVQVKVYLTQIGLDEYGQYIIELLPVA